jgi:hypothetical protein
MPSVVFTGLLTWTFLEVVYCEIHDVFVLGQMKIIFLK